MTRLTSVAAVAAIAAVVGPAAQDQQVFRAGINFVAVDAYPRRDGRLVEGLTAADFEVLEDGVPQAIDSFEFVRNGGQVADADRREPTSLDDANRQAADPKSRVFVLYLDRNHTHVEGTGKAAREAIQFLHRVSASSDLFGLMTPETSAADIVLRRRLASVETALEDYWRRAFVSQATESIPDPRTPFETTLYRCFISRTGDPRVDEPLVKRLLELARQDEVLTDLRELAARLSAIRGLRSHVLLFSSGWNLEPAASSLTRHLWNETPSATVNRGGRLSLERDQPDGPPNKGTCDAALSRLANLDMQVEFDHVLRAARRSNVSIYAVDPGGLATLADDFQRGNARLDWLRTLASETDGVAIVGTNDVGGPLRRVAEELSAYYLLGYYSTNDRYDGDFRRIQVRVKMPDVDVAARRGYLAPTAEMARAQSSAGAAGTAAPDGLTDALSALARLDRSAELFVAGVVRGAAIVVSSEASVAALGRFLDEGAQADIVMTGEGGAPAGGRQWRFEPGSRSALVRLERPDGAGGPWHLTFRVQGVSMPIAERLTVTEEAPRPIAAPLVFRATSSRRSPFRPAPSREFRRTERVRVEWAASGALDARAARLLGRDGSLLPIPVVLTESSADGVPILAADVTLAPLGPGDYVLEVTASSGVDVARHLVAFRVTG
jgi:VWFA-related protein